MRLIFVIDILKLNFLPKIHFDKHVYSSQKKEMHQKLNQFRSAEMSSNCNPFLQETIKLNYLFLRNEGFSHI